MALIMKKPPKRLHDALVFDCYLIDPRNNQIPGRSEWSAAPSCVASSRESCPPISERLPRVLGGVKWGDHTSSRCPSGRGAFRRNVPVPFRERGSCLICLKTTPVEFSYSQGILIMKKLPKRIGNRGVFVCSSFFPKTNEYLVRRCLSTLFDVQRLTFNALSFVVKVLVLQSTIYNLKCSWELSSLSIVLQVYNLFKQPRSFP
jgi:hypothetical protein